MGKGVAPAVAEGPAARGGNRFCLWHDSGICRKSTLKWVAAVVVSINLLIFALLTLDPFHRQQQASASAPAAPPPFRPQVLATFVLQLPADRLNDSIAQLQADLASEIAGLNHSLRVYIMSVEEAGGGDGGNSTVTFAVVPEGPPLGQLQQQTRGIDQLRSALISIFLNESNINLDSPFGPASQFQILKFPGGLTMQPDDDHHQQQQTSPVLLFNFTLRKNLVTIIRSYGQLKSQIAAFTGVVGPKERLDIELTNEAGSTVHLPVVVQVSIASAVPGRAVPLLRLEQLAQVVADDAATSNNLGLDMSTFGDVQALNLSYALVQHLGPAPPPSPGPATRRYSPPSNTHKPPPPPPRRRPPPPTNLSPPPSSSDPPPSHVPAPPMRMPRPAPAPVQPPRGGADSSSSSPLLASHLSMLRLTLPAIVLAAF